MGFLHACPPVYNALTADMAHIKSACLVSRHHMALPGGTGCSSPASEHPSGHIRACLRRRCSRLPVRCRGLACLPPTAFQQSRQRQRAATLLFPSGRHFHSIRKWAEASAVSIACRASGPLCCLPSYIEGCHHRLSRWPFIQGGSWRCQRWTLYLLQSWQSPSLAKAFTPRWQGLLLTMATTVPLPLSNMSEVAHTASAAALRNVGGGGVLMWSGVHAGAWPAPPP